ncbi:MAG: HD domain-containing protein, partial [Paracoccaceae bacterium]
FAQLEHYKRSSLAALIGQYDIFWTDRYAVKFFQSSHRLNCSEFTLCPRPASSAKTQRKVGLKRRSNVALDLGVQYDKRFVQVGIALHDAGKIVHPNELEKGGNLHEAAGEKLLLEHGVDAEIAQCCRSHSQYASMSASFEELIIALADTLWKGSRKADLELRIIDGVAARLQTDRNTQV